MPSEKHVVIGGSGAVGSAVIGELQARDLEVAAITRTTSIPSVDTTFVDVMDGLAVSEALRTATHAYLCVGLPYSTQAWRTQWPIIVDNVLAGCEVHGVRLVFFDNVDMYGPPPLPEPFDERTPQDPPGAKAQVRKQIADTVLEAHASGRCPTLIARSGNFIGPGMVNSPIYTGFIENMVAGKRPLFLSRADVPHTYAYTLDNARAMVTLATDDGAYGQVWHLPVSQPVTARGLAASVNRALGSNLRLVCIPRPARKALGRFVPIVGEVEEMMHHFDHPYVMSWDKFAAAHPDFRVTDLDTAVRHTVASFR